MAVIVEQTIAGWALLLSGTYDVEAATLAIDFLDDTWTPVDVTDVGLAAYDNSAETHDVATIALTSQAWAYDVTTREYSLVQSDTSPLALTVGSTVSFQWALLYDTDNAHVPLALYTWPEVQIIGAGTYDVPIDSLLRTRLYSSLDPSPMQGAMDTLILTDIDGFHWRVTAFAGVLGAIATSEVDLRQVWLTSPDLTLWLLGIDVDGTTFTTTSVGVLGDTDLVFDSDTPCILPDNTASVNHVLSVDNTGALSVA